MINELEAILFISPRPLTIKELSQMLDTTPHEIEELLKELEKRYAPTSIEIKKYGDGIRMELKKEYAHFVNKFNLLPEFSKGELKAIALLMKEGEVSMSKLRKVYKNAKELVEKLRNYGFVVMKREGRYIKIRKTKIMDTYFK